MKDFNAWNEAKQRLDKIDNRPPLVSEGDIWWASIGENIGTEIGGKSKNFTRPVIIYKKLAHSFYLVIPTTTKQKNGTWFVKFYEGKTEVFACLHQVRTIDYRRLYSKLGSLNEIDLNAVRYGFEKLYT